MPDPTRSAVVLIDLQNDFLHPDGAYARGGVGDPTLVELPDRLAPLLERARNAGAVTVFSRFTLWPGRDGAPLISEHLAALRPFLRAGDFAPGSWGHQAVEVLGAADAVVDKVAYSAFAHTRLDWWLRKVGVEHVLVGGIVTNGGVASTVRDAHVREFGVNALGDGAGAFDPEVHDATLRSLGSIAQVLTIPDVVAAWT